MAGHSKWSKIKHQKATSDVQRGRLFTKLAREITVAARRGGSDPEMNVRLRLAIQRARDNNMPSDNIERAIKRGAGGGSEGAEGALEEAVYEGYGSGGVAILLHALTDNRNRTTAEVRRVFSRYDGSLGESGCVAWLFDLKGVISLQSTTDTDAEALALVAIDAGAEDFQRDDSSLEVYTVPAQLEEVRQALEGQGASVASVELSMLPKSTIPMDEHTAEKALHLLDALEELEDIQQVYSNADFPDAVFERYSKVG